MSELIFFHSPLLKQTHMWNNNADAAFLPFVLLVARRRDAKAWFIENGCLLALSFLKCELQVRAVRNGGMGIANAFSLTNVLLVEGIVLCLHVLNATVYREVKTFHETEAKHSVASALFGALTATIPVHLGSHLLTVLLFTFTLAADEELTAFFDTWNLADQLRQLNVWRLAWRFCLFRVVVDIVFYTTHRWQHTNKRVYMALHYRHHLHKITSLFTNFQFTAVDLWLEGSLPSLVANVILLFLLGVTLTPLESTYCLAAVQWYQIGSHNEKDLPCITAIPLLAPLYNHPLLKKVRPESLRNHKHVRFHAAHHRFPRGNYGISPWMDYLGATMIK